MKGLPKLFITDIDGVWTDGGMYYTSDGDVMKRFCVKDGWGVLLLRELGIPVAIMTGENSQIVRQRARKLNIDLCYIGVKDKLELARELANEMDITLNDIAFIGDDINDIKLLNNVGWSGCPANTPDYIRNTVHLKGNIHGGEGAFREFVETILQNAGVLKPLLQNLGVRF